LAGKKYPLNNQLKDQISLQMKKYAVIAVVLGGLFFFFGWRRGTPKFTVLKTPGGITLSGNSAGYVGRAQYEVKAMVINNTGQTLNYLPVFAIIKKSDGKKIGLAMGNTGPAFKNNEKMELNLDTDIPKEMGTPEIIELYSELNNR